ncbi:MAG: hypothetical protein KC503_16760 [Myxococcales bacterium]|nr:hypothetical protein [Myxococcales bacterium]
MSETSDRFAPRSDRFYRPALALARGALVLCGWRLLVRALLTLPLLLSALQVSGALARRPYFADAKLPLPSVVLLHAFTKLASLLPLVAGLALLWLVIEQLLAGGALSWLDPMRLSREAVHHDTAQPSASRTLARDGLAHLFALLRVSLFVATLLFLTQRGLSLARSSIADSAELAGASGATIMLTLPLLLTLAFLLVTVVLSSLALHTRAITVADGRRRVRRTALVALRLWRRHPLRWLVPGLVRLLLLAAGAALLFAWRQSAPRGAALAGFAAAWLGYLVLETYLWYWLLRAARLLYAGRRAAALRDVPDAPWGVLRLLRYLAFWRRRTTSDSTATP